MEGNREVALELRRWALTLPRTYLPCVLARSFSWARTTSVLRSLQDLLPLGRQEEAEVASRHRIKGR